MNKQRIHTRMERQRTNENTSLQPQTPRTPESIQQTLTSQGHELDSETRSFMEPRFGHDFSQVRIHTDEQAAESAQAVNALAYTVGSDIVFGQRQYSPGTQEGKELLAHELTHVVQHEKAGTYGDRQNYSTNSSATSPAEQEAQTVSKQVASGYAVSEDHISAQATPSIHYQQDVVKADGEITITANLPVFANLNAFKQKFENYLQNFRDSNQEACIAFLNTMKSETHETAKADVLKAVLKKAFDIEKKNIIKVVGERIPGLEQFVDLFEAAQSEVERAEKAAQEAALVDFINQHILTVGTTIQKLQTALEGEQGDDLLANLSQAAQDSGDENAFSLKVRSLGESLQPPTGMDILEAMTEEFVRVNESSELGGLFGVDNFRTGILYLKYVVDEGETKANLVEKTLSSPYAAQIKALLKLTRGAQIDTADLAFTRVVRLEREDLDIMNDVEILHAGERNPGERGLRYFARFVKKMPIINVDEIKATKESVLID